MLTVQTPIALVCFWSRDVCTVTANSFPGSRSLSRVLDQSPRLSYLAKLTSLAVPIRTRQGRDCGTSQSDFLSKKWKTYFVDHLAKHTLGPTCPPYKGGNSGGR